MNGTEIPVKTKVRKFDRSHAEIVLRVRQFFERECQRGKSLYLNRVLERRAAATRGSAITSNKLKSENDLQNWQYEGGESVQVHQNSILPEPFSALVRKVIRDMFLVKVKVPTLDTVYQKILELTIQDIEHLSLFAGPDIPTPDSNVWV